MVKVMFFLSLIIVFIKCLVLTSSCLITDDNNIIYDNGDVLEMHIVMKDIPQKFTGYTVEDYFNGESHQLTNYINFVNNNEHIQRQYQDIHVSRNLETVVGIRRYYINFQARYDLRQPNHENKLIVEIHPNYNTKNTLSYKKRHILNYTIKWNPLCVEFNHQQVRILEEKSNEASVLIGEEYEQTCNANFFKKITHYINGSILWSWQDSDSDIQPIRYRFKAENFDNNSVIQCTSNKGEIKRFIYNKLVTSEQFATKNPESVKTEEYIFENGEEYEFRCEANDQPGRSSTFRWIILDANNVVRKASNSLRTIKETFQLINADYDGAKLVCLRYSCGYSSRPGNVTMECSRDIHKEIQFKKRTTAELEAINTPKSTAFESTTIASETKERASTSTTTEGEEINTQKTTNFETTTIASEIKVTNTIETEQVSPRSGGIIIGVTAGVIILIALGTLLFFKVKKSFKVEESPQEELIYASSEIQYAVLDHAQRTNTNRPKNEQVLYSEVTGVLIPRHN